MKLFFLIFSSVLLAKSFQFSVGDLINVTSDRGIREGTNKEFEAIGNVVISHKEEVIYGERATLNMNTGDIHVQGNVRYVSPVMRLFGATLRYNTKTKFLSMDNARILHKDYSVVGTYMERTSPENLLAKEAEYTTCRDCPESWSVWGKEVEVTVNQYITIKHAILKSNGTPILYLPYIVFPIKKERQTGLLFPKLILSSVDGVQYKQPWFWAINDSSDMTLAPWFWGKRGPGLDMEYRKTFGDRKWFEWNSFQIKDALYQDKARYLGTYEHHFQWNRNLTHHVFTNFVRDSDSLVDFDNLTDKWVQGAYTGPSFFFDWSHPKFSVTVDGGYKRNILTQTPHEFDNSFVQVLPEARLSIAPIQLWNRSSSFLKNMVISGDVFSTQFRQKNRFEPSYFRNVDRSMVKIDFQTALFNWPGVVISNNLRTRYQYYDLKRRSNFEKYDVVLTTDLVWEVERVFGTSYREMVKVVDHPKKKKEMGNMIGMLPSLTGTNSYKEVVKKAYRHLATWKVRHIITPEEGQYGVRAFKEQIRTSRGQFDEEDAPITLKHSLGPLSSQTDISTKNTIELQIFNSLTVKTAKKFNPFENNRLLKDNFDYEQVGYFNISQGYMLGGEGRDLKNRLSRLNLKGGISYNNWVGSFDENYFYDTQNHILTLSLNKTSTFLDVGLSWQYNSTEEPYIHKVAELNSLLRASDTINLMYKVRYDFEKDQDIRKEMGLDYLPKNNCWRASLRYIRDPLDRMFVINFLINFGESNFHPLFLGGGNS